VTKTIVHSEHFHIAASHPALPGHFPGSPLVPGVVLLERVAAAIERVWGLRVSGLPQAKFLRPLLPAQQVQLQIVREDCSVRFRISCGAETVATGVCEVVP
jgi:3-hydroxymyristoyl/3-hydroxydecanoyl-(acyl carrier protein) dehydratase